MPHKYLLENWKSGIKADKSLLSSDNYCQELEGLWHHGGKLRSMEGRRLLGIAPSAIDEDHPTATPVGAASTHHIYHTDSSNAKAVVIAHYEPYVWIGFPCSTTVSANAAKDSTTIRLTAGADANAFPQAGYVIINGKEIFNYNGLIDFGDYVQLSNCAAHSAVVAGDCIETLDWRPLIMYWGHAFLDSARIVQVGTTVYVSSTFHPTVTYPYETSADPMRWSGFEYHTGLVSATGSDSYITHESGDWVAAGVKQGDMIYLRRDDSSQSRWTTTGYMIKKVETDKLTVAGTPWSTTGKGPAGTDSVEYIIVRSAEMGITAGTTTTATATAGGSMTEGSTYTYAWRYKSSKTGYSGQLSTSKSMTATSSNKSATVSGWTTLGATTNYDTIEIYRSEDSELTWYLVTAITASTTDYSLVTSYLDTGATGAYTTAIDADYLYHTQPDYRIVSDTLSYFNGRLWCADATSPYRLRFSTLNLYEYWPVSGTGEYGGYITIGDNYGDRIMDISPECSAYILTGQVGGDLLIRTQTHTSRLSGSDWDDFSVDRSFEVGAKSQIGVSSHGYSCWLGADGPMLLQLTSNNPTPIYSSQWPYGLSEKIRVANLNSTLFKWRAISKGDWIIFSTDEGGIYKLRCYHLPSSTWTALSLSSLVASLANWSGGLDSGEISMLEKVSGRIYKLWMPTGKYTTTIKQCNTCWEPVSSWDADGAYQAFKYLSKPLILADKEDNIDWIKAVRKVTICWIGPYTAQTVTASLYVDGDKVTASDTTTMSVAAVGASEGKRVYTKWFPRSSEGKSFELKLEGSLSNILEIDWIKIEYDLLGGPTDE